MNSEKVSDTDRTSVLSSLSGASSDVDRSASQSGEIVGMLRQLRDETTADLDALKKEQLPARLHERGQTMRSKVKVVVNSRCEQMLGKLHADLCSNDEHCICVDTDRIVDVLVVAQREVFTVQTVQRTVEVPQVQFLDRAVDGVIDEMSVRVEGLERCHLAGSAKCAGC